MILTTVLKKARITAGVSIEEKFWNHLLRFLKKTIRAVQRLVDGIVYGSKVFLQITCEGVKVISYHYSKVDQHWEETTITKVISENDVPPEILERARTNRELDITDELEMRLST